MTLEHLREIALIPLSQAQRSIGTMVKNRDEILKLSHALANQGDSIEVDAIDAGDEDDLLALLSHIEIAERQLASLRAAVRQSLEA